MTKMSKAQRAAALEAHTTVGAPLGMFSGFVRPATFRAMVRNGWAQGASAFGGGVTTAGLIAAGVDMNAIHADALSAYREATRAARQGVARRRYGFDVINFRLLRAEMPPA